MVIFPSVFYYSGLCVVASSVLDILLDIYILNKIFLNPPGLQFHIYLCLYSIYGRGLGIYNYLELRIIVVMNLYVTVIIPCCIGDPDDQLGIMVHQVPSKFFTLN